MERGKVEAICILPNKLFYSTDISVTLWILNNNKKSRVIEKNGEERHYRDREKEILFFDLRQMGSTYEKKYVELVEETRNKVTSTFHAWQQEGYETTYHDIPEFCKSVNLDELNGWSLVPSKYIEFANRDEEIDFESKMKELSAEISEIMKERKLQDKEISDLFRTLGFELV